MTLLATLRERLRPAREVPPRCFACRQDVIPLEPSGPGRFFCAVCAKDFAAVRVEGDWRVDLTPLRYQRRGRDRA